MFCDLSRTHPHSQFEILSPEPSQYSSIELYNDTVVQMIERSPHTITEADGTIIKHPTLVTDNKLFFDNLLNYHENMSAGLVSSLMQEPEMEGKHIWLSRATTMGPTKWVTWLLQLNTSKSKYHATKVNMSQELIFPQVPPRLKLNRKRENLQGKLRTSTIQLRNTRLYPMNRRRN